MQNNGDPTFVTATTTTSRKYLVSLYYHCRWQCNFRDFSFLVDQLCYKSMWHWFINTYNTYPKKKKKLKSDSNLVDEFRKKLKNILHFWGLWNLLGHEGRCKMFGHFVFLFFFLFPLEDGWGAKGKRLFFVFFCFFFFLWRMGGEQKEILI